MYVPVSSSRASRLCPLAAAVVAVLALTTPAPDASAKDNESVIVEGAVEVLNDLLYEPFLQSKDVSGSDSPTVTFDIPDGKRLVIESVAFQGSRPASETTRFFMHAVLEGGTVIIPLPVQYSAPDAFVPTVAYDIAVVPIRLRVDSQPGADDEVYIRRGFGSAGGLVATVSGYLVEL